MMGIQHQRRVFATPPGYLTPDERLVLLVLAEQTNDDRLEWAHDRAVIMPMLGLDPDRDADHKWLSRRYQALEEAGFIQRRRQRRDETGQWHRMSIKLELSAFDFEVFESGIVEPTERASKGDPRASNLDGHRPSTRDKRGRFVSPVDSPDGPARDTPEGVARDTPEGDQRTLPRELTTTHDISTTKTTTVDGKAVRHEVDEEEELQQEKSRQLRELGELARTWSLDEAIGERT